MASFKVNVLLLTLSMTVVFLAVNCGSASTPGKEGETDEYFEDTKTKSEHVGDKVTETGKEAKETSESWTGWAKEKITEGLGLVKDNAKDASDSAKDTIYGTGHYGAEKAGDITNKATDKASSIKDSVTGKTGETTNAAKEKAEEAKERASQTADETKETAYKKAEEAKGSSAEVTESAKGKAGETLDAAKQKTQEIKDHASGRDHNEEL